MAEDRELLVEFKKSRSEEAFRQIVLRHSAMVRAAALRRLGDESLADEVTQAVFIVLARKASSVSDSALLAGWLYKTTQLVARQAYRDEQRRKRKMKHFADHPQETDDAWKQISPLLDDAMERLKPAERDALVLRYLQSKSFEEVATDLGTSEAAAKMRVGRAIDSLRSLFAQSGVVLAVSALGSALTAHAGSVVPVASASVIATAALTSGAGITHFALAESVLKLMAWNKIKLGLGMAAVLLAASGGALVVAQQTNTNQTAGKIVGVPTFEPMAGKWAGTIKISGDNQNLQPQEATMEVKTKDGGRTCEIELKLKQLGDTDAWVLNFSHSFNKSGDIVKTVDDSQLGSATGEAKVTEHSHDPKTSTWRASTVMDRVEAPDKVECTWARKGDQLLITRKETGGGIVHLSEMTMKKVN